MGHEVARTYNVYLHAERARFSASLQGSWNDPSNLVTILKWYDSATPTTMALPQHREAECDDDLFTYTFGTNGGSAYRTNTILSGVPNTNKTDIIDGKKIIVIERVTLADHLRPLQRLDDLFAINDVRLIRVCTPLRIVFVR